MRIGDIDAAQEDPAERAQVSTIARGQPEELILDSVRGSWRSYYQNISDVLNRGADLAVKPEQALRAMRVFDAAMRSAATGQVMTELA
jgi:predicted dehydrogenase